jgi:hypothetical protein
MPDNPVSSQRFVAACLAAAVAAPMPVAVALQGGTDDPLPGMLMALPLVMLFGFPFALLHVLLLALPAYQVLRRWWRLRWWSSATAGFVIGILPLAIMSGAWDGVAVTGICGVVGGLTFWAVLRGGTRGREQPDFDETFA